MPKDVKYFPKEAGQVFNPGRNKYEGKPGENRYVTHWKRGFFRLYGQKKVELWPFMDPYSKVALELIQLRKYTSPYRSSRTKRRNFNYISAKDIQSHIGGLDFLNPLVPLSLLCITLSRAMSIKGDQLEEADKIGRYMVLKAFQGAFNALLTLPLTAVAMLTTLLWDVVKATVAAVTTTFSSMITAPVEAARENNRYVVLSAQW